MTTSVDTSGPYGTSTKSGDFRAATIGAVVGFAIVFIAILTAGLIGGIDVGSALGMGLWIAFWGGGGFGFMLGGTVPGRRAKS